MSLIARFDEEQDGPSLESSSYLNVSLRYLGPWDLGTLGHWDIWYGLIMGMGGGGRVMTLENEIGDGPLTFILILKR